MRAANCWISGVAVCPVTAAAIAADCPSSPSILVVKVLSAVLKAVGVAGAETAALDAGDTGAPVLALVPQAARVRAAITATPAAAAW
jgi:hypothetical protein